MLALHHLHDDRDLALAILSHWDYDLAQLQLLDRFRISSNAVYPFRCRGQLCFLRFAPAVAKPLAAIQAELDWLRYLRQQGYPCPAMVLSRRGQELVVVGTERGDYHAVAFAGVPGQQLDPERMNGTAIYGWGKALGWLHRLSQAYRPSGPRRIDHQAQLAWIEATLAEFPQETAARREAERIAGWVATLPMDSSSYGLIHYDFETDNVFLDPVSERFHVIDFDDAIYSWFMLDVTNALISYQADAPVGSLAVAAPQFIAGYRSEQALDDGMLSLLPRFHRYHRVYGHAKLLIATRDPAIAGEPEWMERLRARLAHKLAENRQLFGQPL